MPKKIHVEYKGRYGSRKDTADLTEDEANIILSALHCAMKNKRAQWSEWKAPQKIAKSLCRIGMVRSYDLRGKKPHALCWFSAKGLSCAAYLDRQVRGLGDVLTAEMLFAAGACRAPVRLFQRKWPNGAEWSKENVLAASRTSTLDLDWFLDMIPPPKMAREVDKEIKEIENELGGRRIKAQNLIAKAIIRVCFERRKKEQK